MLGTAMHVTGLGDGAVLYGRYLPISITCARDSQFILKSYGHTPRLSVIY